MLLRRSFLVLSTGWAVALPLAAFAASRPAAASPVYAFALAVYSIGRVICHQLPARSFHLWSASMPVCARCTGIYLGAAAMVIAGAAHTGRTARATDAIRAIVVIASIPTVATLVYEWTTGVMPSNVIRFAAGVPLGIVVSWLVLSRPAQVN